MRLRRLDMSTRADFFKLHSKTNDCGWCCCVAWWVPTWDGWSDRTAVQNRLLRQQLFDHGEFDGYLYYDDKTPIGWCQVGPRDRLQKLVKQFALSPDPDVWAITCFLVLPSHRRKGMARSMLEAVLEDLKSRAVTRVQAFPKQTESEDPLEHWCGPVQLFQEVGFRQTSAVGAPLIFEYSLDREA